MLALECVEGRHQASLDAYLAGTAARAHTAGAAGPRSRSGAWTAGPGFRPLLTFARRHGLEVVGIDRRAQGKRSLELRDAYAAERIARAARAEDRPQVMVLVGQYHVAPCHLPAAGGAGARRVARAAGAGAVPELRGRLLAAGPRGAGGAVEAVELADGSLCVLNASPVVCQQSFLDYLEAEAGDAPLRDASAAERFREMASLIARLAGVPVGKALEEVEVATAADGDVLARIQQRGRFTQGELAQLRRHILSRESCYIPRARMAYLASLSLNHAAEEAAHFVRHCTVGDAMEAPRRASDAFYARCMEEALGFFGSKLVNPRRGCAGLAEWARRFGGHARGGPADRRIRAGAQGRGERRTRRGGEAAAAAQGPALPRCQPRAGLPARGRAVPGLRLGPGGQGGDPRPLPGSAL